MLQSVRGFAVRKLLKLGDPELPAHVNPTVAKAEDFVAAVLHHPHAHLGHIVLHNGHVHALRIDVLPAHFAGEDSAGENFVVEILFCQLLRAALHISLGHWIALWFLGNRKLGVEVVIVRDPPGEELAIPDFGIVGNAADQEQIRHDELRDNFPAVLPLDRFCCGGWACGEVVRSAALPSCPLIHRPGLGRVEAGHAAWSLSSSSMVSPSAR